MQKWVIIQLLLTGNYTSLTIKLNYSMKKFAVIGNPVSHSLSPLIHHRFARQFDIELSYGKIEAESGEFNQRIGSFQENGGCGLNVTVPYKKQAFELSDHLSESATLAQAVNTLSFDRGRIMGDNTDGTGLVTDLQVNQRFGLRHKRILILGAGGAVSGVIAPLLAQRPESLWIANRTPGKAQALQLRFDRLGPVTGSGLDDIESTDFDLLINGTAASLAGDVPALDERLLDGVAFAYDMMYADRPTPFLEWVQKNGVKNSADGLGMLVEQAAASFYLWHGKQPDTGPVLSHLRNRTSN